MKKIILLVLILFAVTKANASDIHGSLSVSYVPELKGFSTEISLNYDLVKWWNVYTSAEVLMDVLENNTFAAMPYRASWTLGTRFSFLEKFYIDLQHTCAHPVFSFPEQFYDKFDGGNRTDIRIGIEW